MLKNAPVSADLLGRLVVHKGVACAYELDCQLIKLLKVVAGESLLHSIAACIELEQQSLAYHAATWAKVSAQKNHAED